MLKCHPLNPSTTIGWENLVTPQHTWLETYTGAWLNMETHVKATDFCTAMYGV